ncbi:unnamed protein product [Closterium sp. Naga37s-1]|nr:unnamed protein product [Closterium sp. Naga37s-1]
MSASTPDAPQVPGQSSTAVTQSESASHAHPPKEGEQHSQLGCMRCMRCMRCMGDMGGMGVVHSHLRNHALGIACDGARFLAVPTNHPAVKRCAPRLLTVQQDLRWRQERGGGEGAGGREGSGLIACPPTPSDSPAGLVLAAGGGEGGSGRHERMAAIGGEECRLWNGEDPNGGPNTFLIACSPTSHHTPSSHRTASTSHIIFPPSHLTIALPLPPSVQEGRWKNEEEGTGASEQRM